MLIREISPVNEENASIGKAVRRKYALAIEGIDWLCNHSISQQAH